ncbi:MAG: sigma-70 family RNA polymerase sigma factor [Tannerellaceae bacterium]|nr:sigma-70 family RNA polymerase sigma factor [Tannerellaceae bacterium]
MPYSNNIQEIDILYRTYVQDLFAYASYLGFERETSKDAIQDIFYKLCMDTQSISRINNKRFYLLRALKNRLLDIYKQTRETATLPEDENGTLLPFTIQVTVEDELIREEDRELIRTRIGQMLQQLTDRQREIIYLRYTQELSYEEIAQLMDITVPATRKLCHKAITRLREYPHLLFLLLTTGVI